MQKKIETYSSSQVCERLDCNTSALARLVASGKVRRVQEPGKKRFRYYREDVDKLVAERRAFLSQYTEAG